MNLFISIQFLVLINQVYSQTEEQAWQEKYLKKYNYLGVANPDPRMGALINAKDQFSLAVKMFQKMAGINQTGIVNKETLEMMEMPRCGVPDLIGRPSITRRKRYAAIGPPWPKTRLTYKFLSYSPDLDRDTIRREIYNAFMMWQNVSGLTFGEVSSNQPADIDIAFVRANHGDNNDFDGPGGTLAHAFFPTTGNAHFDEDEVWTSRESRGVNLLQVAIHEFGHSLGLGHSDVRESIMAPYYTSYTPNPALHQDDVRGIQQLYGPPRPAATQPPTRFQMPTTVAVPRPGQTTSRATARPGAPIGLCDANPPDAIFSVASSIFVFKGDKFYLITSPVTGSVSVYNIRDYFEGVPSSVDAAVYISSVPWYSSLLFQEGSIVFFKDSQYWRFLYSSRSNTITADSGNPRRINDDFRGLPSKIDTAFVWSTNGKLYFTKDGLYYGYSPSRKLIGSDYPRTMDVWQGVPKKLSAAFTYNSRQTNAKTYFFDATKVYKFNDALMKVESGYPVPTGWFFGCPNDNPKSGRQIASSATALGHALSLISVFLLSRLLV